MLPRELERQRSLMTKAVLLADSGQFPDCAAIESRLVADGRLDAPRILSEAKLRERLNTRCARARRLAR